MRQAHPADVQRDSTNSPPPRPFSDDDGRWMDDALRLAERGRGWTSPNPMVGAVVVSASGQLVGRGFHERDGTPHAESHALDAAGALAAGSTLYCNLEPCNHTGRTGPCTTRIIDAGVARVVVGGVDPDPRVSGAGIERLRGQGITVDVGVRGQAAARLNEAFITRVTHGRPFVTIKVALSRDGKIAASAGARTALTSDPMNRAGHGWRSEVDAIGVGSSTMIVDDPLLTVREVPRLSPLTRVIFDRRLRTPSTARMFTTTAAGPIVILTTTDASTDKSARADALQGKGARVEFVSGETIEAALTRLAELGINSLLLEGGAVIHRAAWRAGVVDKVLRIGTPNVLGPEGVTWIDDELSVEDLQDRRDVIYGPDVLTEGYVQRVD